MPTLKSKNPVLILALSPDAAANSLGIRPEKVAQAIDSGALIVRTCGVKRRIAVFGTGGIQEWFESWPQAKRKRSSPCT
jgi:hypothetical protein